MKLINIIYETDTLFMKLTKSFNEIDTLFMKLTNTIYEIDNLFLELQHNYSIFYGSEQNTPLMNNYDFVFIELVNCL